MNSTYPLWSMLTPQVYLFNDLVPSCHYNDVTMSAMASQITSPAIVYSATDERKHQSSASLAFVRGISRWPVNSPHKGPVTQKMFPFDDVIMWLSDDCNVNRRNRTGKHYLHSETGPWLLFSMPDNCTKLNSHNHIGPHHQCGLATPYGDTGLGQHWLR